MLAVFALGADSVDSVGWRIKAAYGAIQLPGVSDRFLTPRPDSAKSRPVISREEQELLSRCRCPVCCEYERVGWQRRLLDASFTARMLHNAWVFLKEVESFRKAILRGTVGAYTRRRLGRTHRFARVLLDGHFEG